MKTIEQMLRALARTDVSEFAIASGRLPCVKVSGTFQPIDDVAPTSEQILQMLVAVGGSRYVDSLTDKPTQWTTRVEGVGAIAVATVMREDRVQARFVVAKREEPQEKPPVGRPAPRPPPATSAKTPSTAAARTPSVVGSKAPSFSATKTPSTVASKTPSFGASKTPSTVASKTPSFAQRAAPRRPGSFPDDVPTAERPRPGEAARSALGEIDFDAPPSNRAALPRAQQPMALPANARELDLGDENEAPTRPGAGFELDLERAVVAATVTPGTAKLESTARDIEFEPGGGGVAASHGSESLDEWLEAARIAKASDLHVIAERPLLFRIGGDLVPRGEPLSAAAVVDALMARVPMRVRDGLTKDGSCDFALERPGQGRIRASVVRQRTGLKACFRLIPKEIPTLASLGLPADIAKATHHHQGLIVVTGPTGHGKTTTLAAIVDILNRDTTHHIITVEDPIEFVHPRKRAMMSQREVGTHTRSFQNALKASLREDPDVIVVGELRDTETVRMALSASETGHLVLGTMNTPSAAKTIDRVIDLFPPADQGQVRMTLAGSLHLIVSQRLLPSADGGVVAAVELLPGSIALWALIRDQKTFQIPSLQQRGKGYGIVRLDDSLADLVRAGKITQQSALAVAENPEELEAVLAGKRQPAVAPDAPKKDKDPSAGLFQKAGSLFGKKGA